MPSAPAQLAPDPFLEQAVAALGVQRGTLLNALEDAGAGRAETWPRWVRQLLLAERTLNVHERFSTTLFLLGELDFLCKLVCY